MYFFLKNKNVHKDTPINLIYYVRAQNKLFKYSTGQKINPKNWDFERRMPKVVRGSKGVELSHVSRILNRYVDHLNDIIRQYDIEDKAITKHDLKRLFDEKFRQQEKIVVVESEKGIAANVNIFLEAKNKSKGQSVSWNHKYENLRNKILMFDIYKRQEQTFEHINDDWIDEYCGFLRSLPELLNKKSYLNKVKQLDFKIRLPKTGYNDNTLYRHINFLFTFLNWSYGKYHNINIKLLKNPIRKFKSDQIFHTEEELDILHNLEGLSEALSNVRDVYLIGCYSGQRYGDYSVFENADVRDGMIINRNQKTRKISYIPLHSRLKELLDKHDWKLPLISAQKFRDNIKKVGKKAGFDQIEKVTNYINNKEVIEYKPRYELIGTHTARRTFANISHKKRMTLKVICDIMGLTMDTLTKTYIITSEEDIKRQTFSAWDN